ncbi:MAG: hypothetical protein AAF789_05115 [Bacteroidota bacterium]
MVPDKSHYNLLANLRQAGDANYHGLTSTYLTILTLLMGFDGVLFSSDKPSQHILAFLISSVGIYVALQMIAAQTRFRAQNWILDRNLRGIESKNSDVPPIHSQHQQLVDIKKKKKEERDIPEDDGMPPIKAKWILRNLRFFPRMKALPKIIIMYFLTTMILEVLRIIKVIA